MTENTFEHTTVENVDYWERQVEAWFDANVHGKPDYDIIGIAGDVVIEFGDSWNADDADHIFNELSDHEFPVYATRGDRQVRIEATNERLKVPYADA